MSDTVRHYDDLRSDDVLIVAKDRFAFAQNLAKYLGFEIVDNPDNHPRDTQRRIIQYINGVTFASNERLAYHELGHFIVAHPSRRFVENYGLGDDPDFGGSTMTAIIDGDSSEWEEIVADTLGGLLYHCVGGDVEEFIQYHSWDTTSYTKWVKIINQLIADRHIDENLHPTILKEFAG